MGWKPSHGTIDEWQNVICRLFATLFGLTIPAKFGVGKRLISVF